MPIKFQFSAIKASGEQFGGEVIAADRRAAVDHVERNGGYVTDIRELTDPARLHGQSSVHASRLTAPSRSTVTAFIHELSLLLSAGFQLSAGLRSLADGTSDRRLVMLIAEMDSALAEGEPLHEVMQRYPHVFDAYVANMVRVGEASGTLADVLMKVAETRERQARINSKMLSALLYPSFLLVTAFAAILLLMIVVVPQFKTMLENVGAEPPYETRLVLAASDWILSNGILLATSVSALVVVMALAYRLPSVQYWMSAIFFSFPVVGRLMRLDVSIRFFRSLSTLLGCGVELPESLQLTNHIFRNHVLGPAIEDAHRNLRQGGDFIAPLASTQLFPQTALSIFRAGHESSQLDHAADRIVTMFEEKFDRELQRAFVIFEPAVILVVSIIVAGIVLSIVGAVVSVNDLLI